MTRSMTGYGRAPGAVADNAFLIEVTTVNHRFLESNFRMPAAWCSLENALRDTVKRYLSRGKVFVSIRAEGGVNGRQPMRFDPEVAQQYVASAEKLAALLKTSETLSLNTLARLDGVFYQEERDQDLDQAREALNTALVAALQNLNTSRSLEGKVLAEDISRCLAVMRNSLAVVEVNLPALAQAYETRLRDRVKELGVEPGIREERLAVEIALMAEKTDVNEEVVRLKAHLDHVAHLLLSDEPVGRELNFLSQEIQREANTLGSKLRDLDTTREVLRIKTELEKMKEQLANIE